ncbi:MAG: hypothetical protein Q7S87_08815 [Agitococcus sp.]|nr:hypothetical protein [Agitococcus sp.]MDO9177001.1 hypothetical protein [Agitococcus sp.]
MIHAFFLVGTIKKIQVSEPKDPKKNASAVLLVQYGVNRESTGGAVEFVNAVMIRVPSFKYPQIKDKLRIDASVQINGHLQGVFKSVMDDGFFTTELVADRIFVDEDNVKSKEVPDAE